MTSRVCENSADVVCIALSGLPALLSGCLFCQQDHICCSGLCVVLNIDPHRVTHPSVFLLPLLLHFAMLRSPRLAVVGLLSQMVENAQRHAAAAWPALNAARLKLKKVSPAYYLQLCVINRRTYVSLSLSLSLALSLARSFCLDCLRL